jgi:hypothetical protein
LERVVDRNRAPQASDGPVDPSGLLAASFSRRMILLSRGIYFAGLSALMTAELLIGAFLAARLSVSGTGRSLQ